MQSGTSAEEEQETGLLSVHHLVARTLLPLAKVMEAHAIERFEHHIIVSDTAYFTVLIFTAWWDIIIIERAGS